MKPTFDLNTLPATEELLVLCATSRLAQTLQERFGRKMMQAGKTRWRFLAAQTIDQWFDCLAEEILLKTPEAQERLSRHVLSDFQAKLVFEQIIADDLDAKDGLFDIAAMASTAVEAHHLATTWGWAGCDAFATQEQQRFGQWQRKFLKRCEASRWADRTRYRMALLDLFESTRIKLPQWVVFAGFDRFTPIETRLEHILAQRGVSVGVFADERLPSTERSLACADLQAEIEAAAQWSARCLAQNPNARLGIVVANLAQCRNAVADALDQALSPLCYRPGFAALQRPFNISLGIALTDYPIVRTACDLLTVMASARKLSQTEIGKLLCDPFWSAGVTEIDGRCRLDAHLRQGMATLADLSEHIPAMCRQAGQKQLELPALFAHLRELEQCRIRSGRKSRPSVWAQAFERNLQAVGWLAEYALSSPEYQTRQAFLQTLGSLAELDEILGEVTAAQALMQLRELCGQQVFQAQTVGTPPVQVLGFLEAAGMQFDQLWVLGLNDHVWPPSARPNPLLPLVWQRANETPNATAAVQMAFAQVVHERLRRSAPIVHYSWSTMDGEVALRPSPLLQGLPVASSMSEIPAVAALESQPERMETLDDAKAPVVATGEHVRGGTGLMQAQAICPAWAYYKYRLGASKLLQPVAGLDAAKRGTLVHDALEFLWSNLKDSASLRQLSAEARKELIGRACEDALTRFDNKPGQEPLKPRFRALEGQRLARLLDGWLAKEQARPAAFTVIANERQVSLTLEGIQINMRIDRIDQLGNGELLIIDYKTGSVVDTKNWAAERITEPQLPIYAALTQPPEGPVTGVLFAKVKLDKPGFGGITNNKGVIARLPNLDSTNGRKLFPKDGFPDWQAVLSHWKSALQRVAQEIRAGDAGVRYADEAKLRYCDVLPLLRLSERQRQLEQQQNPGSAA